MADGANTRVGLVGCGFMGHMHGQVYHALDKVDLVSACDLDQTKAEEVAHPHGGNATTDFQALLADPTIGVIDICLPTFLHEEYTVAGLAAGKHVVCEKPMALSSTSAQRMLDARDASGKTLMIAHCIRFWPEYQVLKSIFDSNQLGSLLSINMTRFGAFPSWSWEGWLGKEDLAGGGALDMHIHDTDFAHYLLGEPDTLRSNGTVDERGVTQIFTTMTKGRSIAHLEGGFNLPAKAPFKMSFRAIFERGLVNWDGGPLTVYEEGKEPVQPELTKMAAKGIGGNISDLGGYYFELAYFYDCIRAGLPVARLTPESSKASLDLCLMEIALAKKAAGLTL